MDIPHSQALTLFKALADASRLAVLRAIDGTPRCVEEIATAVGLAASTVSHHLARLEEAGLVRKSREQYYTVYTADAAKLDLPLRSLLDAVPRTHATRGAMPDADGRSGSSGDPSAEEHAQEKRIEAERRKVLAAFFKRGRLVRMPVQRRKKMIVLGEFLADFIPGRTYRESEVDAIINRRHADHCTIRRLFIDEGIMTRSQGLYRLAASAHTPPQNEPPLQSRTSAPTRTTPMNDRKQKILAWKMTPKTAGCFAITNTRTGRVFFGSSLNLHGPLNKHRFALEIGGHGIVAMQRDWNTFGPDAFTFEVLETVPQSSDPTFDVKAALEGLEKKWLAKLDPYGPNGYNESKRYREA